ncbi:MAG: lamin tail domain-containing protein [Bacteroidia bacterium]|nr:lamin tail domain-containing protein [Bacteroidia bacterium]
MKTKLFLTVLSIAVILMSGCVKDEIYVGPPTIAGVTINPMAPGATDEVIVTAQISDLKGISSAKLFYKIGSGSFISVDMTAGTPASTYTAIIPTQPLSTVVAYYLQATNVSNLTAVYPANAPTSTSGYTVGAPAIVINEVFSRGVVSDPDWIELYNSSNTAVDISGYKIYDAGGHDATKPKMVIPASTTMAGKGYYVIVVDDAATANPTGSNFGLSSTGDEVWLESAAGFVIDNVPIPAIPIATNSYGRKPDGSATFEILTTVTKNAPNSATSATITGLAILPLAPKAADVVTVSATVTDAQGLSSVKLWYKIGAGTYASLTMTAVANVYSGVIPAQAAGSVVSYYLEAINSVPLTSYSPETAPTTAATYTVASPPVITGLAKNPVVPGATDPVVVSATITDAVGFGTVKLYYKVGAGSYSPITMTATGNVYSATIPAQVATSIISYYVEAINTVPLTSYAPATAPATPATYTVSSLSSITGMAITPTVPTPSDIVTVSATITDIQGISVSKLYYKIGAGSYTSLTMTAVGDVYSANIPAQVAGTVVSYYIEVTNVSSLKTYAPATAPATASTYTVAGSPVISLMGKTPSTPTSLDQVTVSATVTGMIPTGTVKLFYAIGTGSYTELAMTPVGDVYSAIIPQQPAPSTISYYIEAKNSASLVTVLPAGAPTTPDTYSILGPLVLNEVCGSQIPDDDWVEFYNSSGAELDISGFKIIKDGATTIWTAPAGTKIAANGYAVVPTLVSEGYGLLTAGVSNTKAVKLELKTAGDVLLSFIQKTASNLGGASGHTTGGSYARIPNATGDWTVTTACTRGTTNPSSK